MGFRPHIPGSRPCPRFCPHPRFRPHHLWSMTTLSLPLGGLLVGVVSMRGKGHWLGVGGGLEYTRNPDPPPLWIGNPIFFFTSPCPCNIFCQIFLTFFLLSFFFTICVLNFVISFLHVYSFPFSFFSASVGSALKGGHCHDPCQVVSHVTPVTLL